MIYLFSKIDDLATNGIVDWLAYKKQSFIRVNEEKADSEVYLDLYASILKDSNKTSKSSKSNTYWFRRPDDQVVNKLSTRKIEESDVSFPKFPQNSAYFSSLNSNYRNYLRTFFHLALDKKETKLGSYYRTGLNKIDTLEKAKKLGLCIPPYIITGDMSCLREFYKRHNKNIICKTLFETVYPVGVTEAGFLLQCLTAKIDDLDKLPDEFFPSLFQKNIEKQFEIRTFFLDGTCYSAAMFTQNNEKTQVDFRNYDTTKRTRIVPYKLDKELEEKISALMATVGLDCGSIDIIKGLDGQYYFLEINPVGQFGWISSGCNYNFPKLISENLIKKQYGQA